MHPRTLRDSGKLDYITLVHVGLGLMFAGKKDDYSFFLQYCGVDIILSFVVFRCAWGVFFSIASASDLTTATWDAGTSGKTGFVKPDWDKLMEQ